MSGYRRFTTGLSSSWPYCVAANLRCWFVALVLLAQGVSLPALGARPIADQPLSTWRNASSVDKTTVIGKLAEQLEASADVTGQIAIPSGVIERCVDRNRAPDQINVHGKSVPVTVGLVVVLCIKMNVAALAAARYEIRRSTAPMLNP